MTFPYPSAVVMCPPASFDVIDVKNPFMAGNEPVDRERANAQWESLRRAFVAAGLQVHHLEPLPSAEDMVFTANPVFTGVSANGERVAVASRMKFQSRRAEVEPQAALLEGLGHRIDRSVPETIPFEGGGDAVWHPLRNVIYFGHGWRSDASVAPILTRAFGAEIVPLRLVDERFYHLDTALCTLDEETALVVRGAFEPAGLEEVRRRFSRVIDVPDAEALVMAANAATNWRGDVVIELAATETIAVLKRLGYRVNPVDTSEFRKSGGSVYCMKQYVF